MENEENQELVDNKTQILTTEEPVSEPIVTEPTEEQIAFKKLLAEMEELHLEKGDIVIFRNGVIGRIDGIFAPESDLMYRIYVKITNDIIVTLDENLKNLQEDGNYDGVRIISKDFTNTKLEVDTSNDVVLTKEQAQEELTNLKGQNVVIQ